jgi:hypothetical protein
MYVAKLFFQEANYRALGSKQLAYCNIIPIGKIGRLIMNSDQQNKLILIGYINILKFYNFNEISDICFLGFGNIEEVLDVMIPHSDNKYNINGISIIINNTGINRDGMRESSGIITPNQKISNLNQNPNQNLNQNPNQNPNKLLVRNCEYNSAVYIGNEYFENNLSDSDCSDTSCSSYAAYIGNPDLNSFNKISLFN